MNALNIKCLLVVILFAFIDMHTTAQCPASKYGITPVWPHSWTETERQNWYLDMSVHGQGFQSNGHTWRQIQVISDSNDLLALRDEIHWAKTNGGIEKFLYQFKNPGPKVNSMPPLWCGNPLTDTNTTKAMYRYITGFLDTMHTELDYFVLGSEADVYFKGRPAERDSFLVMAEKLSLYIDSIYPSLKFSVGVSLNGTLVPDTSLWHLVEPFTDFMAVSWWPLQSDYLADTLAVSSFASDMNLLLAEAGTKPIIITDCGIPTKSQPERYDLQSEFVRNTFLYTYNNPQIEAVGYQYLADFDSLSIEWYQGYFLSYNENAEISISSRGLLDSTGVAKPAYDVYIAMLDTVCLHASTEEMKTEQSVHVWPVPCTDRLYFQPDGYTQVEICDASGRVALSGQIPEQRSEEIVSVAYLEPGVWFLKLSGNGKVPAFSMFIKTGQP